MSITHIARMRR